MFNFFKTAVEKDISEAKATPRKATNDTTASELVDVKRLISQLSVEQLNQTADHYFAQLDGWDYHLAKPFAVANETPELIISFAHVLHGLSVAAGMTVLDFGAGSCWSSRLLTQFGCEVIALDVSQTALEIGQELYRRQPVIGSHPEPKFLRFDGHRIDLLEESVDRILCLDAFHHVANTEEVLKEMARVLKSGGIAAFSEPGPEHSKSPQAQYEMRMYRVIENDVKVQEIWECAHKAGFADIKLAVLNPNPFILTLKDFEAYLEGNEEINKKLASESLNYMQNHRIFFLYKGEPRTPDSRRREGLLSALKVTLVAETVPEAMPFSAFVTVTNVGTSIWLPTTASKGPVHMGTHLLTREGELIDRDYSRHVLTAGDGCPIAPGETVTFNTNIPSPQKGKYILEFDLVSEWICWFEHNGSQTVKIEVEVI